MQRVLMDKLIAWKDEANRKPLILQGIKHSGKTYLLKEFGEKYFKHVLYIDFSENKQAHDLFDMQGDAQAIIKNISIYMEKDIRAGQSLIIFDEIQFCPGALDALKLFAESARDYHIAAAGSFIDAALPHGYSMPGGKVSVLTLYPMSFYEFILAQSPMLAMHLKESGFEADAYKTFQKQLDEKFRDYQIVGGMPQVVQSWIERKSIETVDKLLADIIRDYECDFARFAPISMFPKLIAILNSVPAQLIKQNRKFMFSKIKKSWRAKDLDDALYWLLRAGLVYKVEHIEKPEIPLSGQANPAHFKLYMCDVGLFRRMGGFRLAMMLSGDGDYAGIKGAIAETVVCCDLIRIYDAPPLYYWSAVKPGRAEVDFIVQDGGHIIPIEVKYGSAGRARSLLQYKMRFSPAKSVLTGADKDKDEVLPLCGFWNLKEWIGEGCRTYKALR